MGAEVKLPMEDRLKKVRKVVVAGEGGSGKTTMLNRLVYRSYKTERMTIGMQFHTHKHPYLGDEYWYAIWDFAGEERFRFILRNYMQGTDVVLLCFDQSRYATFLKLDDWIATLKIANTPLIKVLIGTKSDLGSDKGTMAQDASAWCERNGFIGYHSCSALTGYGVTEIFDVISEQLRIRDQLATESLMENVKPMNDVKCENN